MVQIGGIYLGGRERHSQTGVIYNSGVAFSLSQKSPVDGIYQFESGMWEVEIQKNNQNIIARCKDILSEDKILSSGFDFCQKYLDLLSVAQKVTLGIDRPGQDYILLFNIDGRMKARIVINNDLGIGTEVTVVITDKDGNVKESPPLPQPNWLPAFRYYRVSQSGRDLYDAYRNLYLAFESLLQEMTPINSSEKEIDWLQRALNDIGQKISLQDFVPIGKDPIFYITGVYYEHFRCKTFQAKNRNYLIPHEWADAEKLSEAYEGLLRLWRQIAITFKSVPGGGSVVTYEGFMLLNDPMANEGFKIQFTDDPSPENTDDTQVSPLGHIIHSTTENVYVRDYRPGIVLFKGNIENPEAVGLGLIHRVCLKFGDTLFSVAFYGGV
jgi:hypothetical protein